MAPATRQPVVRIRCQAGPRIRLAPCVYKADQADGDNDEVRRVVRGFKLTHVFALAQTEGENLPEVCQRLQGNAPYEAFGQLAQVAHKLGYSVDRERLGGTNGDCNFGLRRIRVNSEVSDAQAVKTLAHELAHAALHENVMDRPSAELEAESVAYIVTSELRLDSSGYTFGYVTVWAGGGAERSPASRPRESASRGRRGKSSPGWRICREGPLLWGSQALSWLVRRSEGNRNAKIRWRAMR